jgi:hypothetical protein
MDAEQNTMKAFREVTNIFLEKTMACLEKMVYLETTAAFLVKVKADRKKLRGLSPRVNYTG